MADSKQGVEYEISVKDATSQGVASAKSSVVNGVKGILDKVKSFASGIGSNLANIQAGFQMLGTIAQNALGKLRKAFQFETMTVQFKALVGSMDDARAHMAMLQEMGDTPPFSLEEFAKASRSLMVMTDGALGFEKSLQLVGDAAAATGQPIQNLAHEVGRAYAIIRDGQPLTRATMGLRNMGAITPEVAQRLEDLQKSGASNLEVWQELEKALGKFKGAMEETEQTGEGLMGAISAQWDDAVRTFGGALLDTVKDGLALLLEKMKELNQDGTIAVWADRAGRAMEKVAEYAKIAFGWLGKLKSAYEWMRDGLEKVGSVAGAMVGTWWAGGTHDDALEAGTAAWRSTSQEQADRKRESTEREAKVREDAVRKRQQAESDAAKKRQSEDERIAKQMAEAKVKNDERAAAKLAEKEAKAAQKRAEKLAKEEERLRERLERELHKTRMKNAREEAKEKAQVEAEAQKRLAAAQSAVRQAWGWYRDKGSLKAQLEEEKADAAAQSQFEKDFEKLRFRRDWREAKNLSLDQEAVRRVALAREEERAAQEYAKVTAEASQRAAESLENIEKSFAEVG